MQSFVCLLRIRSCFILWVCSQYIGLRTLICVDQRSVVLKQSQQDYSGLQNCRITYKSGKRHCPAVTSKATWIGQGLFCVTENVSVCFCILFLCRALFCHTYAIVVKVFTLYILLILYFYAENVYSIPNTAYTKLFGLTGVFFFLNAMEDAWTFKACFCADILK